MPMGTATDSAAVGAAITSPLWVQALHGPAREFLVWGGCILLVLRLVIAVRAIVRWRNQERIHTMSATDLNSLNSLTPREIVARTLWGEARGEGIAGMAAVAGVIANRARNPRWWGRDPAGVCLKPQQFSCWLHSDPNRPKLQAVTEADPLFRAALALADEVLAGRLRDVTNTADHYHTKGVAPQWSAGKTPVATIGVHRFFRLELAA